MKQLTRWREGHDSYYVLGVGMLGVVNSGNQGGLAMTQFYSYIAIRAGTRCYWIFDSVDVDLHGINNCKPLCRAAEYDIDWSITKCVK